MTIKVTYNVTDVYVTQDVSPVYINVSYSGSSGGAAVWGSITGTLSNQSDLQNALNAKFDDPTGTTSQYLRGDGTLATFPAIPSGTVTSVGLTMPSAFSVANSPITSSGTLAVTGAGDTTQYIAGDGSLVAFPITGQADTLVREVRNVTGATLTKGTVVYINGASGNKPTVAKALATGDATSAQTFGLIQADIANNSNGYLVAFGDLDGLNTSAFAEGVQLYLSATTAGDYTSTKQYAPNHLVYIGVVTRQHVNQGRIEVRIQNGYEMDELHDVSAQTPSNNDGLFYNSTNSLWENKSIATALGYTPANAATTLTINGVTYDLSTSRTWTISAGISGSGASGQVSYWDGTTSQAGSNNLFWDSANVRLGVGTNAPVHTLDIMRDGIGAYYSSRTYRNSNFAGGFTFLHARGTSSSPLYLLAGDRLASIFFKGYDGTTANDGNGASIESFAAANHSFTETTADLRFSTTGAGLSVTENMRLTSTGRLMLQNGGTFTDSGERLQVTGTMKVTGNLSVVEGSQLQWAGSREYLIGGGGRATMVLNQGSNGLGYALTFTISGLNQTSGVGGGLNINPTINPTSGTGVFTLINLAPTINQTGGANGITRVLYVNPTLTSAADFRAIETTNGKVIFGNLPTSSAGLPTGAIWNDAGTIKIV